MPGRLKAMACLSFLGLTSCAGPMTPFGALHGLERRVDEEVGESVLSSVAERRQRVHFTPERQNLHGPATFSVIIEDPEGVPEKPKLTLSYNGLDISSQFMEQAEWEYLDPAHRKLKLTSTQLRLLPERENKIKVVYWPVTDALPVSGRFMPPRCSAFDNAKLLDVVPGFDPPDNLVEIINEQASTRRFNPYYVAGLIAQESSFNSRALSSSRALGLTQVTTLGEAEILKAYTSWPRYPGITEMPLPLLKLAIYNGKIHAGNEWRLDPERSIVGGISYLEVLNEYWNRPDKKQQLERTVGRSENAVSEVILASYNSGPARVSQALDRLGKNYLNADELGEARRYVARVTSYCDHFENQGE